MVTNSLILALVLSLINGVVYFGSMYFAWNRSSTVFFSTFYGTLFWKIIVISAVSVTIFGDPAYYFPVTLVASALGTFVFTILSIFILQRIKCRGF